MKISSFSLLMKHKFLFLLLIIFIFSQILLFLYHFFPLTHGETDGIGYMTNATGQFFHLDAFHGPGYSFAIRLVNFLGVDLFSAAKVVSITFGVIYIIVTWLLISCMSNIEETTLATALITFSFTFVTRSNNILSDMMAATLFLSSLACLLVPIQVNRKLFFFSGILGGLTYLTRSIYLVTLILPLLRCFLARHQANQWKQVGVFYMGFLIVCLPWFVFLYTNTGNPFYNQNYLNLAFKMYNGTSSFTFFPSSNSFSGWMDVIRSNPILFLESWIRTFIQLPIYMLELFPKIGIIGSIGFFLWISKLDWRKTIFLIISTIYGMVLCLVWLEDRFVLVLMPLTASFLASGLYAIPQNIELPDFNNSLSEKVAKFPLRKAIIIASLILLGILTIRGIPPFLSDQAPEYKEAAEWLSSTNVNQETPITIMAVKPHIAFFSAHNYLSFSTYELQYVKLEDLPKVLDQANPTYFVYDERYAAGAKHYSQFSVLLTPEYNPYPELLQVVLKIDFPKKLVIYKYEHPQ